MYRKKIDSDSHDDPIKCRLDRIYLSRRVIKTTSKFFVGSAINLRCRMYFKAGNLFSAFLAAAFDISSHSFNYDFLISSSLFHPQKFIQKSDSDKSGKSR